MQPADRPPSRSGPTPSPVPTLLDSETTTAPRLRVVPQAPAAGSPAWRRMGRLPRVLVRVLGNLGLRLRAGALRTLARARFARAAAPLRLCLGSGNAPIPGWVNVDLIAGADVRLDLRYPLPLPDRSVAAIYSEHFVEHLPLPAVQALLRECRRVLADDGVLRLATPDLAAVLHAYHTDWRDQEWVRWPEHAFVDTGAHMLNVAFGGFGHHHLFDQQDLELRLRRAGFAHVARCALGDSQHRELRQLETRADSLLVLEAWGRSDQAARSSRS